ncbi:polyphosphate kinase 2, partial [bacterium]|nr:polyphosphate kinase 2 [bacterium]
MKDLKLTKEDVEILNTKIGLKNLFSEKKLNYEKALRITRYELKLRELQVELIKLQNWVIENGKKIVIIFEGRDA